MIRAFFLVSLLVGLSSAQFWKKCRTDAQCDGYCLQGTCRPYIGLFEHCNVNLKCRYDLVCNAESICVDNTCDFDHDCGEGYCNIFSLCQPFGETGDKCDASSFCAEGYSCDAASGVCVRENLYCGSDNFCPAGYMCDKGSRTCQAEGCAYDSECSARYFCRAGKCTERPSLAEKCGGDPFTPCAAHLTCNKDSVCEDPSANTPCSEMTVCGECVSVGFRRCSWEDGVCRSAPACSEDAEECALEPKQCSDNDSLGGLTGGPRFSLDYDTCMRDLDCAHNQFCYGGQVAKKKTGRCNLPAEPGSQCGGSPQMKCQRGLTCVVQGSYGGTGTCVVNDKQGLARVRSQTGVNRNRYAPVEEWMNSPLMNSPLPVSPSRIPGNAVNVFNPGFMNANPSPIYGANPYAANPATSTTGFGAGSVQQPIYNAPNRIGSAPNMYLPPQTNGLYNNGLYGGNGMMGGGMRNVFG